MAKNIYLIGFMGVGKTTVSKKLAEISGWAEVDTDAEIAAREGTEIPQIFEEKGEAYFREIETGLIKEIAMTSGKIISCGGGVILNEENRKLMKESGVVVLLTASPETIYDRVKSGKNRPLLNGNMNTRYIAELMAIRMPYYHQAKTLEISTDGKSSEKIAKEIYKMV